MKGQIEFSLKQLQVSILMSASIIY